MFGFLSSLSAASQSLVDLRVCECVHVCEQAYTYSEPHIWPGCLAKCTVFCCTDSQYTQDIRANSRTRQTAAGKQTLQIVRPKLELITHASSNKAALNIGVYSRKSLQI
jgi:hypothetical protein